MLNFKLRLLTVALLLLAALPAQAGLPNIRC
jgi:hypothetical protein